MTHNIKITNRSWLLKYNITVEDCEFADTCGIEGELWHPIITLDQLDPLIQDNAGYRYIFSNVSDQQLVILTLKYGDQIMPAKQHWYFLYDS